jgi:hypothetical protein
VQLGSVIRHAIAAMPHVLAILEADAIKGNRFDSGACFVPDGDPVDGEKGIELELDGAIAVPRLPGSGDLRDAGPVVPVDILIRNSEMFLAAEVLEEIRTRRCSSRELLAVARLAVALRTPGVQVILGELGDRELAGDVGVRVLFGREQPLAHQVMIGLALGELDARQALGAGGQFPDPAREPLLRRPQNSLLPER